MMNAVPPEALCKRLAKRDYGILFKVYIALYYLFLAYTPIPTYPLYHNRISYFTLMIEICRIAEGGGIKKIGI
jgi:predicted acyltransferase